MIAEEARCIDALDAVGVEEMLFAKEVAMKRAAELAPLAAMVLAK